VPPTLKACHPLHPIDADEIAAACGVAREHYAEHVDHPKTNGTGETTPKLRFPVVALVEPDRDTLRSYKDGDQLPRLVELVAVERHSGSVHEIVVDVAASTVVSWDTIPGARPALLFEESGDAIVALLGNEQWLAALALRGITDLASIQVDPWPAGNFGLEYDDGRRLVRCVAYRRDSSTDNGYAHPVEGLVGLVDVATGEVLEITDTGVVPIPVTHGRYGAQDVGPARTGLRPLEITQPEGPSFAVEDNEVRWMPWRFRFTIHPIEGLVLHQVTYTEGDRVRPVLDRASIAEMVVPYGAHGVNHWWKNAFDAGEWGLGRMMQPLALGCDCLGEIRYADAVMPDEAGGGRVVPNAVCMHEEDYGILWKHVDLWGSTSEVRRSRRFVISSVSTVGNYDYGFFWYFYLDGTIQLEVKLTGIMQTGACDPAATEAPDNGALIAPGLWAPTHQHLFCARLDVCVDGPLNTVEEVDAVGEEAGPANPYGNGIRARASVLETESGAKRMADQAVSRRWRIINRGALNGIGRPTSYALVPSSPVTLLATPESSIAKRATFATRNLWVTPYEPTERRPAGNHPNQHEGGDGLPAWTVADRPIVDRQLVVWHTFGVSHLPRPEDWPVMPVEYAGFALRPVGFFDRNPALDLPSSHADHCA